MSVLGMHRSGTSLTARVLNLLGLDLGPDEDLLEAADDNPRGFWEQRPMMDVNDAIFEALGGTWYRPPEMPPGWERRPEVEELKPRAQRTLAAQFGEARTWGWKDPRTSLTLPFWRELIPGARYVVCLRRPNDVVESLLRREPETHSRESAMSLWLRYSAEALENTASDERLLVFYEDYFADRDRQLARLAEFVGRDPGDLRSRVGDQIGAFIEADLRHYRTSAAEVAEAADVPLAARSLFLAARLAHLSSMADSAAEGIERVEPGLIGAVERFFPRLWHDPAVAATLAAAREERDAARRAEREQRAALERAEEDLERANEALSRAVERHKYALGRARAELRDERRMRRRLESSLSWRLTRPLRAGRGALAGVRRLVSRARARG